MVSAIRGYPAINGRISCRSQAFADSVARNCAGGPTEGSCWVTTRAVTARSALIDVIRQVRRRWRIKLALARRRPVPVGTVALVLIGSAYALESLRFSPDAILAVPHRRRSCRPRVGSVVHRPAADAESQRRTGGALSRRARTDARSDHHHRDGGRASGPRARHVADARPSAGRGARSSAATKSNTAGASSDCRSAATRPPPASPPPPPCSSSRLVRSYLRQALSALLDHFARCRSGCAVSNRSHAWQCQRAARRRLDASARSSRVSNRPTPRS